MFINFIVYLYVFVYKTCICYVDMFVIKSVIRECCQKIADIIKKWSWWGLFEYETSDERCENCIISTDNS